MVTTAVSQPRKSAAMWAPRTCALEPCALKCIHGYISALEDWQLHSKALTDKAETAVHCWLFLTCRVLEENMVITVEPGCYFNRFLLEPAFQDPQLAKFLRPERISQFWVRFPCPCTSSAPPSVVCSCHAATAAPVSALSMRC